MEKLRKLAERKELKKENQRKKEIEKKYKNEQKIKAKKDFADQKLKRERLIKEQKELIKESKKNQDITKFGNQEYDRNVEKIKNKKKEIAFNKSEEEKKKNEILETKKKERSLSKNPEDFTQITVLNKLDVLRNKGNKNDQENEIVLDNLENKFKRDELIKKRQEEIQRRKYSYFNKKDSENDLINHSNDKRKQFFDETSIKKTFTKKNNTKSEKSTEGKKKLEKKSIQNKSKKEISSKKDGELLAAIIQKPSSIVELKEQVVNEKREVLNFDSNNEELGIKHKKKLKEFALIIKDKPVKIIIRTYVSKNEKDYNKYKKILKSRSLFVRAFLINQGISHNRIKIETNEENITKNWKNEVILNFIGV